MTSTYHTPVATGAAANAATINSPLSELDSGIAALAAAVVAGSGGAATTLASTASTSATTISVVDASGFEDGMYIDIELDSGGIHATTVNGAPSGNTITLANAMPSQATASNYVSSPDLETVIARGSFDTLGERLDTLLTTDGDGTLYLQVDASAGGERNSLVMFSEGEHVFERDQLDSGANGTVLGLRRRNMNNEGRSVFRLAARNAGDAPGGVGLGANIAWQLADHTGASDKDVGYMGFSWLVAPDGTLGDNDTDGEASFQMGGFGETTPYTWVRADTTDGWRQFLGTFSVLPISGDAALVLDSGRDATPAASAIKFLNDEVEYYRIAKTAAHDLLFNRYSTSGVYIDSPIIISGANGEVEIGKQMRFTEMTAPSAPPANSVVLFAEDNGAGKTRLMARFATGAAQQVAIEP